MRSLVRLANTCIARNAHDLSPKTTHPGDVPWYSPEASVNNARERGKVLAIVANGCFFVLLLLCVET